MTDDTFYFRFFLFSRMCTAIFNSVEIIIHISGYFNGIEKHRTHFRKETKKYCPFTPVIDLSWYTLHVH